MPVKALKPEGLAGGRCILHGDAFKLHLCGVQGISQFPDMIFGIGQRRRICIAFSSQFGNPRRTAGILDEAVDRNTHFFPSFSFF